MEEINACMARLLTEQAREVQLYDIQNIFEHITASAICGNDSMCCPIRSMDAERIISRLQDNGFRVEKDRNEYSVAYGEPTSVLYIFWRQKHDLAR